MRGLVFCCLLAFAVRQIFGAATCVDNLPNCAAYGQSVCTNPQYNAWVDQNCAQTCGRCSDTTTCADKAPNCAAYGPSVCTDPQYDAWVDQNCAQTCGRCDGTSTGSGTGTGTGGTGGTVTSTGSTTCVDKNQYCAEYNQSVCTDPQFDTFIAENCARTCGRCSGTGTGGTGGTVIGTGTTCADKVPNCAAYGQSVCTDPQYDAWISQNCARTCGRCGGTGTGTGTGGTGGTVIGTATTACVDKDPNCADYDQSACTDPQYAIWATENCARTCGRCSDIGTVTRVTVVFVTGTVTCVDTLPNCAAYGQSICTNPQYNPWVDQNCAQTCGRCSDTVTGTAPGVTVGTVTGATATTACVDKMQNCADYDQSACTDPQYATWATENCARTCGRCSYTVTGTASGVTVGTVTGATGTTACADKVPNCAAYGQSVCTDPQYNAWVDQNCAKTCSRCSDTVTGTASGVTVGTVTGAAGTTACADKVPNCAAYGQSVCTDPQYNAWVDQNCAKTCSRCSDTVTGTAPGVTVGTVTGATGTTACADKAPNCATYGQSVCTNPQYNAWVDQNCAQTCGRCSENHACADNQQANCAAYGQQMCSNPQYMQWVQQNCRKFCNMCSSSSFGTGHNTGTGTQTGGTVTGTSTCADSAGVDCSAYGQAVCSDQRYTQWVSQNCAAFCGRCAGSSGGTVTGTGTQTGGTFTGTSSGCEYVGVVYQQGQRWMDSEFGFTCTCVDGSTGQVHCDSQ